MAMQMGRAIAGVVGAGLLLAAPVANASNGTKPRIPVDWTGGACMTIVDRSASTMVNLPYAILMEDTDITDDEVDDSRTHQFFGYCRSHDPQTFLPRWITQDDIDRAIAKGAAPDNIEVDDVLETSEPWADCWFRLNADDDRHPITFAAAMAGIDWETAPIPTGTYVVEAYTWEPPFNIWSVHPGVVKVVDTPALDASGPALAIRNTEEVINKNDSVVIEGCVSAMEGSTATGYWVFAEPNVEWTPFIEGDPVEGESFALEFQPPEEAAGQSVLVRVDIQDPMGRSYTHYMRELVIVLGTDGPGDCQDGSFIGGAGCEDDTGGDVTGGSQGSDGTGDGATATDGATHGTPGQDDDGGGRGCGCHSQGSPAPWSTGMLALVLLGWRRRRVA